MGVQVSTFFFPPPLSAHWSIVIGLSVSALVLSFVVGGFCRVTRGREREKGTGRGRKGRDKVRGGTENGKDVCKSMSMTDSSTKSPDIYSALLTHLKKKKKKYSSLFVSFFHPYSAFSEHVWLSELAISIHNNGNESNKKDALKLP